MATSCIATEEISSEMSSSQEGMSSSQEYFDIVIVGRTGQGKSTLGNKLLRIPPDAASAEQAEILQYGAAIAKTVGTFLKKFKTADDVEKPLRKLSVTDECKLLSNGETMIRVLDTPGFSPSNVEAGATTYQTNLQIFRWIVREQLDPKKNMAVQRLLYFLPNRGVLEKADGTLQDELKVMHYFFGTAVFNNMVIIATQARRYQSIPFTEEDKDEVKYVFFEALQRVTDGKVSGCPPILYFGIDDHYEDVLYGIMQANTLGKDNIFVPAFADDKCSRCTGKIRYSEGENSVRVGVLYGDELVTYEKSKCHPKFIHKYSTAVKVAGGLGHVATLGIPYAVGAALGKKTWPGFILTRLSFLQAISRIRGLLCSEEIIQYTRTR